MEDPSSTTAASPGPPTVNDAPLQEPVAQSSSETTADPSNEAAQTIDSLQAEEAAGGPPMPPAGQAGAALKPSLEALMSSNEDAPIDDTPATTAAQAAHLPVIENGTSVPDQAGTGDAAMAAVDERLDPAQESTLPHTNGYTEHDPSGEHHADTLDYSKVDNLTGSMTDANEGQGRVPPMSVDIDQPAREEDAPETQGEAILPAPGNLESEQPVEEIDTMTEARPAEPVEPTGAAEASVITEEPTQQAEQTQPPVEQPDQPVEEIQQQQLEQPMDTLSEQIPQPPSTAPEATASASASFDPSMESLPDAPAPLPSQLVNHTVPSTNLDTAGASEVLPSEEQQKPEENTLGPEADPSSIVPPSTLPPPAAETPTEAVNTKRPYEEDTSFAEAVTENIITECQEPTPTADEPTVKRQKLSPEETTVAEQPINPSIEPSLAAESAPSVEQPTADVKMESAETGPASEQQAAAMDAPKTEEGAALTTTENDAVDAEAEEDVDAAQASPEPPNLKEEGSADNSMLVDNSMIDQSLDAPGAEDSTVMEQPPLPLPSASTSTTAPPASASPAPTPTAAHPTAPSAPAPTSATPASQSIPKEQSKYSLAILRTLKKKPEAAPFLQPVDPIALGIPHYTQIIPRPMDLSTVEKKLQQPSQYKEIEEFYSDMRQIWQNCYTFNGPDSGISNWAKVLSNLFEKQIQKMPSLANIQAQAAAAAAAKEAAKEAARAAAAAKRANSPKVAKKQQQQQEKARRTSTGGPKMEPGVPPPPKKKASSGGKGGDKEENFEKYQMGIPMGIAGLSSSVPLAGMVPPGTVPPPSKPGPKKGSKKAQQQAQQQQQQQLQQNQMQMPPGMSAFQAQQQQMFQQMQHMQQMHQLQQQQQQAAQQQAQRQAEQRQQAMAALNIEQLKFCKDVIKEMFKKTHQSFAYAFYEPVDYVALGIPDYPKIIHRPMDLGTMKRKLEANQYPTAAAFENDFKLLINNCFTYNPPNTPVHKMGENLQAVFYDKWQDLPQLREPLPQPPPPQQQPMWGNAYGQNAYGYGGEPEDNSYESEQIMMMQRQLEMLTGNLEMLRNKKKMGPGGPGGPSAMSPYGMPGMSPMGMGPMMGMGMPPMGMPSHPSPVHQQPPTPVAPSQPAKQRAPAAPKQPKQPAKRKSTGSTAANANPYGTAVTSASSPVVTTAPAPPKPRTTKRSSMAGRDPPYVPPPSVSRAATNGGSALKDDDEDDGSDYYEEAEASGAAGGSGEANGGAVVTFDMKKELAEKIQEFDGNKLDKVVEIIRNSAPELLGDDSKEIELDIDMLDQRTLLKLYEYVVHPVGKGRQLKQKKNKVKGRNRGVDEVAEEERINALQAQLDAMAGAPAPGGPSGSTPPGQHADHSGSVPPQGGRGDVASSSSEDEDDGSESESDDGFGDGNAA